MPHSTGTRRWLVSLGLNIKQVSLINIITSHIYVYLFNNIAVSFMHGCFWIFFMMERVNFSLIIRLDTQGNLFSVILSKKMPNTRFLGGFPTQKSKNGYPEQNYMVGHLKQCQIHRYDIWILLTDTRKFISEVYEYRAKGSKGKPFADV